MNKNLINTIRTQYDVTGSDISKEMKQVARRNYPEIDFIVSNPADGSGSFDCGQKQRDE